MITTGYAVSVNRTGTTISKDGKELGVATMLPNHLQVFKNIAPITEKESNFVESKSTITPTLFHQRFGHISYRRIATMVQNHSVKGLKLSSKVKTNCTCTVCTVAKMRAKPHIKYDPQKQYAIGEVIVSDWKPLNPGSSLSDDELGFVVYHDMATAHGRIFVARSKSEQLECFKIYKAWFENQTGKKIKNFRSDRGTEFTNKAFVGYLKSHGIQPQTSAAYSHESVAAESRIRVMDLIAKSLLVHSGLPRSFYMDAFRTANYLVNRAPDDEPHQKITKEKPRIDHLRVFGCKAVYYLPKERRKKGDFPSRICRFIGYSANSLTYRIWNGEEIVESRDVQFFEKDFKFNYTDVHSSSNIDDEAIPWITLSVNDEEFQERTKSHRKTTDTNQPADDNSTVPEVNPSDVPEVETPNGSELEPPERETESQSESSEDYHSIPETTPSDNVDSDQSRPISAAQVLNSLQSALGPYWNTVDTTNGRRPRNAKRNNAGTNSAHISIEEEHKLYNVIDKFECLASVESNDFVKNIPKNYKQAIESSENVLWRKAIVAEHTAIKDLGVYEMALKKNIPPRTQLLNSTYVFDKKQDPVTDKLIYKARLCVLGNLQKKQFTTADLFAGVARTENLRLLFKRAD